MSSLERVKSEIQAEIIEQQSTAAPLRECESRTDVGDRDFERRLKEQTAELREANARLAKALEQRDILLREVYHRVKNNLQVVDLLLAAQARATANEEGAAALRNVRQRVFAMGLVHQQLTHSEDLKTFDIAQFLKVLSKNIIESGVHDDVEITVQSIPLAVGLDFAIPLGLLVTELVTNSLKHAFPDGTGDISVVLQRRDGDKIALIVADNGQPTESGKSAPFASQPGRGINIITGLVAELQGAIAIETRNGTRTEIVIAAPIQT
ncbi:sensor histidine kinase [Rhodoblastus sp.]|uniref:sensor histidine kinase n=1 Tax=Rhodoblastus sp. TaxID=1962975 RepID=UPI003F94A163